MYPESIYGEEVFTLLLYVWSMMLDF